MNLKKDKFSQKYSPCLCLDMPVMDYKEALELQRGIVKARKEKRINNDIILLLEHEPVFTLGRNGGIENLVVSQDFLTQKGIRVFQIERGGNITWHGPGQIIVYPVLDLNAAGISIIDYVSGLEAVMIQTAGEWGIKASGSSKNRGVWVENRKLGSVGITVTRGVCFHGLALNVNNSLEPFTWINPCGLHNISMTSIKQELSHEVPIREVRNALKLHIAGFLGRDIVPIEINYLREMIDFK